MHSLRTLFSLTSQVASGLLCAVVMDSWLIAAQAATTFQSLDVIQQAAEAHIRQLLPRDGLTRSVKADRLDDRLRLTRCLGDLEVFLPSGANLGARTTAAVRCPGTAGWTLYLSVNISTQAPVLISNRAIARGAELTGLDVSTQVTTTPGLANGNLSDASQIADSRAKRDIPAGTALTQAMIEPRLLIKRGQQVTLLATAGGIEVRSQGVALADGGANARIRVKNLNSAKVVEGRVDSSQLVRVEM